MFGKRTNQGQQCDEEKPECGQCKKSKRPCKPFRVNYLFVDQNQTLGRKKQRLALTDIPVPFVQPPRSALKSSNLPTELRTGYEIFARTTFTFYSAIRTDPQVFRTSSARTKALTHSFDTTEAPESYARALVARYGDDEGLDAIMTCLFRTLEDVFKHGPDFDFGCSNAEYGRALISLRQSVTKHLGQKSDISSVVGAIMLAALYESLTGGGPNGVHTHQAALAAIFENKRPEDVTDFERQVLLAVYGGFVNAAIIENRPCFLEERDWQDYLGSAKRDTPGTIHPFEGSTNAFLQAFSRTPGLLVACSSEEIAKGRRHRTCAVEQLVAEVRDLHSNLVEWELECSFTPYKTGNRDVIWSIFSGDRQIQGTWLNYSMAIALLSRILIYLDGFQPELENDAYQRARLVMAIHEANTKNDSATNSRTLTVFMRYGLALVHTHASFMRCDLDLDDDANDRGLLDYGSWRHFHDMIRGRYIP